MFEDKRIMITGGAGFIGGNLIRRLLKTTNCKIFNLDNLCYSSDIKSISNLEESRKRYEFFKIDLKNYALVSEAVNKSRPDLIIHLAAETHVDRSLEKPLEFIESNIIGTFNILQASLNYFNKIPISKKDNFRFHHVSTDEVFGSLSSSGKFNEETRYDPRSPYSASKASSDHLVRSYYHSYNLPIVITNCSNNYGPYQFPEKLIPLSIIRALKGENILIYGDGNNIRDWIYVEDHIEGLLKVASKGENGKTYCLGGENEINNNKLIDIICAQLDTLLPGNKPYSSLIKHVSDRPGHDFRYSIDSSLIKEKLNWEPKTNISQGINKTVRWYVDNIDWCNKRLESSGYNRQRLGTNFN